MSDIVLVLGIIWVLIGQATESTWGSVMIIHYRSIASNIQMSLVWQWVAFILMLFQLFESNPICWMETPTWSQKNHQTIKYCYQDLDLHMLGSPSLHCSDGTAYTPKQTYARLLWVLIRHIRSTDLCVIATPPSSIKVMIQVRRGKDPLMTSASLL